MLYCFRFSNGFKPLNFHKYGLRTKHAPSNSHRQATWTSNNDNALQLQLVVIYISMLITNMFGDIEIKPGPTSFTVDSESHYLSGACQENCTWENKAFLCENCESWLHTDCIFIDSELYSYLAKNSSLIYLCQLS